MVKEEIILMDYLIKYVNPNRKKVKSMLTNKCVKVNNKIVSQYNYLLHVNDLVEVNKYGKNEIDDNIDIIYEDKNIIVINKPYGLLTIATNKEKEKTLYNMVSEYVKIKNKNNKIFIVHRLDRDTSGIIIFAKDEKTKNLYQDNWNDLVKYRGYVAIVEGSLDEDTTTVYLKENKSFITYVTSKYEGKEAITYYKPIRRNSKYTLLDIEIKTGRKNQIRATMQYLKHPIVGDTKYGSSDKSLKRLGLHAYKLNIVNPINNKLMTYEVKIPSSFKKLVK